MLATKSLSLPIILVLVIETSIWINFAAPLYTGMHEFFLAYLIVSSIQLGVAVDYGILIADRYREDRVTMHKREALLETMEACTIPVLTSGSVLLISGFLIMRSRATAYSSRSAGSWASA
ncbi:MAG: MMPL family transporter [Collinsella sp.]